MSWARRALIAAVLPAVVAGACTYLEDPDPYRPPAYYDGRPDEEALSLGQSLYQRDCSFCHGNQAEGTPRGPDLVSGANGPALTDFMLRTGRMPINDPDEPTRPRNPVYDDEEIAAIVAYLDEEFDQPGPDLPEVDPEAGDIALGQGVYQEHCAACHASTGIGGSMLAQRGDDEGGGTSGVVIPDLSRAGPLEVGEAVRTGPGTMPRFGPGVIDGEDLDALVRYVEYLRDPDDRGGAPIGRVGPVVEGGVGWLLGLGVLVLFIRWVGTKRGEHA